jgi:hypothetical protein
MLSMNAARSGIHVGQLVLVALALGASACSPTELDEPETPNSPTTAPSFTQPREPCAAVPANVVARLGMHERTARRQTQFVADAARSDDPVVTSKLDAALPGAAARGADACRGSPSSRPSSRHTNATKWRTTAPTDAVRAISRNRRPPVSRVDPERERAGCCRACATVIRLQIGGECGEDVIGGLGPDERLRVAVPRLDPGGHVGLQGGDTAVGGSAEI